MVTTLIPYGPERPKNGIQDPSGTGEDRIEIFWDPPKGEFTKYTLEIDKLKLLKASDKTASSAAVKNASILRLVSVNSGGGSGGTAEANKDAASALFQTTKSFDRSSKRQIENLSHKLTRYTIMGLEPAEAYSVSLGTKTGQVSRYTTLTPF